MVEGLLVYTSMIDFGKPLRMHGMYPEDYPPSVNGKYQITCESCGLVFSSDLFWQKRCKSKTGKRGCYAKKQAVDAYKKYQKFRQSWKYRNKKLRFAVLAKSGFACVYCGRKPPEVKLHIDHVHPLSRGGGHDIENLVAACVDCNSAKSNQLLENLLP